MRVEDDPEHVPYLAVVPIRGRPDIRNRGHVKISLGKRDLETHVRITLERQEVIDDGESAWRLIVATRPRALVDRGQIEQHAVRPLRFQFQIAQDVAYPVSGNPLSGKVIDGFLH